MGQRGFKIDFFRVVVESQEAFEDVLDRIAALPDTTARNQDVDGGYVRLETFETTKTQRMGDVTRIRMTDGPVKASIKGGPVVPFKLDPHEGFGEQTAFFFDSGTSVLVIQSHKIGVTPGRFASYVQELGQANIELQAIETEDALARLGSMRDVTRFEFGIAPSEDASGLKGSGASLSQVNDMIKFFGSPSITLTVTRGHERSTFLPKMLVDLARRMSGQPAVTKLRIRGTTDDRANDALDLVFNRLRESGTAQYDDSTRTAPFGPRKGELQRAWLTHAAGLRKRFKT